MGNPILMATVKHAMTVCTTGTLAERKEPSHILPQYILVVEELNQHTKKEGREG